MSFLTLRIEKIKIIDNKELLGNGEVKLLSFVTSEDDPLPILDNYFTASTGKEKLDILKAATSDVISSKILMQIDNIKDGQELIFGDTGYALWTTKKYINSFNWQMILIEIDNDVRQIGGFINDLVVDPEFEVFLTNIAKLAQFAINPTITLSIAIGKFVFGKVADILLNNKDDQLGIVYQSFCRGLDFPRQAFGIPDISGNLRIDYRIYVED